MRGMEMRKKKGREGKKRDEERQQEEEKVGEREDRLDKASEQKE